MFVNFNILNQLGSPAINSNTFANRPAAGQTGRLFVSTDTFEIYRDNGTSWDLIGGPGTSTITGTGTATQVAYFTSSQAIGSSANLFWDNTNGYLGVGTATPGARIEAVKTDGYGIYANYTTNVGSGASTTAIYAINNTASSGYAAVIEERTGNTNGGQYPLLVKHSLSSGTAAVGNGTGLQFQLQDDAGTFKTTQLTIETIDAAAATYSTRYRFNVQSNGSSTPMAYLNATGLGIKTATPLGLIHADGGASAARIILDADSGVAKIFSFRTDALPRWAFRVDGAETGSNAGADFALRSYDDTGALLISPLSVTRANGKASWQASETYSSGLARANYFDYNLSVAAGASFSSPNAITALGASLDLTLAGNATIPSGARSGLDAYNTINFTGTGTLTQSQGTQIRAYSNLTAGWSFSGAAAGTITHLAGLRVLFPDAGSAGLTITNNYGLLINDQTANTGTVTYTNRWGIYQEGASDLNYLNANLLIKSTVNNGNALQVTGNGNLTGDMTADAYYLNGMTAGNGALYWTSDRVTLANYNASGTVSIETGGGTQAATFLANQNVGIGLTPNNRLTVGVPTVANTVSPVVRIHTTGVYSSGGSAGAGGSIQFGQYYDSYPNWILGQIASTRENTSWGGNLLFYTNDNSAEGAISQRMIINSNGYVGINTGSPTGILQLDITDGTNNILVFNRPTVRQYGVKLTNGDFNFLDNTAAATRFIVTTGGNFLIGTTTDAGQKLQVNGTSNLNGNTSINITAFASTDLSINSVIRVGSAFTSQAAIIFGDAGTPYWNFGRVASSGDLRLASFAATVFDAFAATGKIVFSNSIKTAAPTTGTAAEWKLGSRVAATVVVNTTEYIEVDIGGTLYKLATVS